MNYNHLGFFDLVRLSTRVFFVKPMRTFLTILGTSVGISAVIFLVSLGYGFQYLLLGKLVTTEDSLVTLSASYPAESGLVIHARLADEISSLPGATETSRMSEFSGEAEYQNMSGLVLVRTIEGNYYRLAGSGPDLGEIPSGESQGIIVTAQALRLVSLPVDKTSLGKEMKIKVYYQNEGEIATREAVSRSALPIAGIMSDENEPPLVFVDSSLITEAPPYYKELLVKAEKLDTVEPLREKLTDKGFLISAKLDLVNQARKIMNAITIVLGVFGITALVVSAIGMFNTMIVGFLERIYEVGVMKSLGATDGDVRNLFLMESVLMGLSGGVAGVAIGIGAGKLINFGLNLLAARMGGKALDLFITPWWFVGLVLSLSAFIGLVAGMWPAHRASGLSPKEAFLRK